MKMRERNKEVWQKLVESGRISYFCKLENKLKSYNHEIQCLQQDTLQLRLGCQ